jgi:endonuclease YncB( thermonuclease family)
MALGKPLVVAARLSAALVLVGAAVVLCADLPARASAERIGNQPSGAPSAAIVQVVDGQTIENLANGARYRLENVEIASDADQAACDAADDEAARATAAAEQLVGRARTIVITPTGRIDRAGQPLVFVSLDGRDLGELLMAQGAARPAREGVRSSCGDLLL